MQLVSDLSGVVLVDKPQTMTSNRVLQKVKRIFGAKKAGHTGSLDPLATGMLPVCLGSATRFSQYALDADKCYQCQGRLGIETDSGDSDGNVIATTEGFHISNLQISAAVNAFKGSILQVPPMYSALKHQGKPLYTYARKGEEIERPARMVQIFSLQLIDFDGINFSLEVLCSKGTYIRTLVEDIGKALGVGAHVTKLRRLYCLGFESDRMVDLVTLENLSREDALRSIIPTDRLLGHLPEVFLPQSDIENLVLGRSIDQINANFDVDAVNEVRVYDAEHKFYGVIEKTETSAWKVKRLLPLRA